MKICHFNDIITESARQAVQAKQDTEQLKQDVTQLKSDTLTLKTQHKPVKQMPLIVLTQHQLQRN